MTTIKPARVDASLVKAFEKARDSGGRVSEKEVKELIAPRFKDAGKLTETEKATLAWAIEEFKLTPAAKRALSDEITKLVGQPVFEWQRSVPGTIAIRFGDQLTQKELDQKASLAFQQNTVAFGSEWGDAFFNHPESGNSGTHVFAKEGKAAQKYLEFLAAVNDQPELLEKFSPKTHAIYTVYESDDEEHYGGIIVDKKTGEAVAIDDFNIVDVSSTLSREQFESIFGEVKNDAGERVSDEEYEDHVYNVDIGEQLGRDDRSLELPNFSAAQVQRREKKLDKAAKELREGFEASTTKSAGWDYGTMARTDGLDARLPTLFEQIQSADWRDSEREGVQPKVKEPLRAFDDAAMAAAIKTMQAVNPDLSPEKMKAFIAGMGNPADLKFAVVELPMQIRTGNNNRQEPFTATAIVVVNEKEGDWFGLYDRKKMPGD